MYTYCFWISSSYGDEWIEIEIISQEDVSRQTSFHRKMYGTSVCHFAMKSPCLSKYFFNGPQNIEEKHIRTLRQERILGIKLYRQSSRFNYPGCRSQIYKRWSSCFWCFRNSHSHTSWVQILFQWSFHKIPLLGVPPLVQESTFHSTFIFKLERSWDDKSTWTENLHKFDTRRLHLFCSWI